MSVSYTYARQLIPGGAHAGLYNTDHPERRDAQGEQIFLAQELEAAFPGKSFSVQHNGELTILQFENPLTASELQSLDHIIYRHQNNLP